MSGQGYVIFGTDDYGKKDNIVHAALLAMSIKMIDHQREICVVVQKFEDIPKQYEDVFDYVVELPFGRTDTQHKNIFIDFWQLNHCSPFHETMFVNTYTFALSEIESFWDAVKYDSLVFFKANDFKKTKQPKSRIKSTDYVQFQNLGADIIYFKSSRLTKEFFKMADPVFKNWRHFYQKYADNVTYRDFDLSVMVNIVAVLLGETYFVADHFSYTSLYLIPENHHANNTYEWFESINFWVDQDFNRVKVNNYVQTGFFVYQEPDLIDDDIVRIVDGIYRKKNKKIKS